MELRWSDIAWERRRFAYVAVLRLLRESYLNEYNMPSDEALQSTSECCTSFLEVGGRPPAKCILRCNTRFVQLLQGPPTFPAETGERHQHVHSLESPGAGTAQQSIAQSEPVAHHAEAATVLAASSTSCNAKGKLNELMMKVLGRPVQKGDVEYMSSATSPFVTTLRLSALESKPYFVGRPCSKRVDAEQSAASQAMDAADKWSKLARLQERVPSQANLNGEPVISQGPCGDLQEAVTQRDSEASQVARDKSEASDREEFATQCLVEVPQNASDSQEVSPPNNQSSITFTMPIREWCVLYSLPEALADRLEDEEVQNPSDLTELSEADLDELCVGLKLGHKGRFKRCVKDLKPQ